MTTLATCRTINELAANTHGEIKVCQDTLPAGAPYEIISKEQAEKALQSAREIYSIIQKRLPDNG